MTAQTVLPARPRPPARTTSIAPTVPAASRPRPARVLSLTGDARSLVLAGLIDTVGTGLVLAGVPVFLVRSAGLTVGQIAAAVTVAGLVAIAASIPIGGLTDRWGPREVAVLMCGLRALAVLSFLAVGSPVALAVGAAAALTAERGGRMGFRVLGSLAGAGQRVRLRERLRSATTAGVLAGAVLAGALTAADSRLASVTLILTCPVLAVATGVILARLPRYRPASRPAGPARVPPLRDRPYLTVAVLNAVLSLAFDVLSFALPLGVVTRAGAPVWFVAVSVVLSTALVAFVPVPVGRGLAIATRAAVSGRRRTAFVAAAVLIAFAGHGYPRRLAGLLLAAAVVLAVARLPHA